MSEESLEELEQLIPKKRTIVIGIEDAKQYKIFPKLSLDMQIRKIPEVMSDVFNEYDSYLVKWSALYSKQMGQKDKKTADVLEKEKIALIAKLLENIRKNAYSILQEVTGLKQDIIGTATNDQLMYALDIIFKENYEDSGKNLQALLGRAKNIFLSGKSSQELASSTEKT